MNFAEEGQMGRMNFERLTNAIKPRFNFVQRFQLKRAYKYWEGGVGEKTDGELRHRRWLWNVFLLFMMPFVLGGECCNNIKPPNIAWHSDAPYTYWDARGYDPYVVKVVPAKQGEGGDKMYLQIRAEFKNPGGLFVSNKISGTANDMNGRTIWLEIGGNLRSVSSSFELSVTGYTDRSGCPWPSGNNSSFPLLTRTFIPSNNPTRDLYFEYDHQARWDIFDSTSLDWTKKQVNAAFWVADRNMELSPSQTNLPDNAIGCGSDCDEALTAYADSFRNPGQRLYLIGVKNISANPDSNWAGRSLYDSDPQNPSWTFLFMEDVYTSAVSWNLSKGIVVTTVLVHELGHQVAGLDHPQDDFGNARLHHDSPFCVMNQGLEVSGDNDFTPLNDFPGVRRTIYYYPFFCPADVGKIRNSRRL
ncbi:MAG: hypothetical protein L0Y56_05740 [Nitrospira sp.]|nr:hypothetical protein [Nitrospira sp.]